MFFSFGPFTNEYKRISMLRIKKKKKIENGDDCWRARKQIKTHKRLQKNSFLIKNRQKQCAFPTSCFTSVCPCVTMLCMFVHVRSRVYVYDGDDDDDDDWTFVAPKNTL